MNADSVVAASSVARSTLAFLARPQCGTVLEYRQGQLMFGPEGYRHTAIIRNGDNFQVEQLHRLSPETLEKCHLLPNRSLCWGKFMVVDDVDCLKINEVAVPLSELAPARIVFIGLSAL